MTTKTWDAAGLALGMVLAAGAAIALIRIPGALGAMGKVLLLFALSVIASGVFMIGRHHARKRRERRNEPPPEPPRP